ncbi:kinase-like protein [Gigaspora margarita]|uniref:Kinase-like protein n=1 Tax=Gigaspora margarita TaxID=4874 RepID=A0A8H4ABB8_GIGMA|nr:kinase-like protein [Gigaspora margarita]
MPLKSRNILINDGEALIADFGISKHLSRKFETTSTSSSNMVCTKAYTNPRCLKNGGKVKQDVKSDIYSLGVLLWVLTSGVPPFYYLSNYDLVIKIENNEIENIIDNTPQDYANIYKKCWLSDLEQCSSLDEILFELERVSVKATIESIENNIIINNKQIDCNISMNGMKLLANPQNGNFVLFLQFANGGDLWCHLQNKIIEGLYKISWNENIQIAKEITVRLEYLHSKSIIHQSLNPKNILINNGSILITGFGTSRQINDIITSMSNSDIDMIVYTDPRCFLNIECDMVSDIL